MANKKKKYKPKEDDDWDEQVAREHCKAIDEKTRAISEMHKKWWDTDKHRWKDGFEGHGNQ